MTTPNATSPSLLARAVGRDELAWTRLHQLYRPLIAHWCRHGGVPDSDVDDVVQEVIYAISAGLADFHRQRDGAFRAWARGITRHKCLDWHRRLAGKARPDGGSMALERLHAVAADDAGPGESDESEAAWLYRRAVEFVRGEFTEKTWQAFWRTGVEERPTDVVAAELGMTPVAVRIAKSRVLSRLRAEIGELTE